MEFQDSKAIFKQIADRLCMQIMTGEYADNERVPSVRDCSAELEVNINTALRGYEKLQRANIIYLKRGMGYYVTPGAGDKIREMLRTSFFEKEIVELHNTITRLGITPDELAERLRAIQSE